MKSRPVYWDIGWCVIQLESRNWAVLYNGHVVESEFASQRDADEAMYAWELEMAQEWRAYA